MSDDDYAHGTGDDDLAPEDDFDDDAMMTAEVEVDIMEASMTAFGSVVCEEFGAKASAIASAAVSGEADISGSMVGAVSAENASLHRSIALATVASGDAAVSQSAACAIVARSVDVDTAGVCCMVTSEATVARSWVGFMAARNAELSDDSRVIIDTRAGLIIGALLFGGLGLLAVATYLGARKIAERIPHLPHLPHMPSLPEMPHMPEMPRMAAMVARMRHAG